MNSSKSDFFVHFRGEQDFLDETGMQKGREPTDLGANYDVKLSVLRRYWDKEIFFNNDRMIKWLTGVDMLENQSRGKFASDLSKDDKVTYKQSTL